MDETRRRRVGRHLAHRSGDDLFLFEPRGRRARDAAPGEGEILDRVFALGPDLFGVARRNGQIIKVNPAWGAVLGYGASELIGTSIWDLIHPAAVDACNGAAPDLERGGISGLAVRMRHKDGGDRWIDWDVAFAGGRLFAVGRDMTGMKQLEAALERAREEARVEAEAARRAKEKAREEARVEAEAARRAKEKAREEAEAARRAKREAREEAEAARRAKGEFLAGISHEIRTPMTAILGFADLLADRWRRPDAAATADDLDALHSIRRNGDQLLGLIDDILDLTKIEGDRTRVELAPCSPAQVVADVMGLMHVRAKAQGLSLDVEFFTPIPASITTDAIRLRQILINLIGNAIKFTDRGGVLLRVHMASFRLNRDGDGPPESVLQFDVADTGIGIRADEIARVFLPFYRVDSSQTRRHGGAGLGLSLSLRLAVRLGGTIVVRSQPRMGSVFTLMIPAGPGGTITVPPIADAGTGGAAAAASRSLPAPATAPASPPLAYRVLLAEDNLDTRRVMMLRLAAANIEVTPAPNGQVAVDLALAAVAAGRPFDVILMDMQMPVLDGYEATRTLRAAGYRRPIIAVTAHAMAEDRDECLRFGCDDFVAKPIDWPRLTSLIVAFAHQANAAPPPSS